MPLFVGARAFIPLAYTGCGFGCSYCYIPAPRLATRPLESEQVRIDLERVRTDPRFIAGPDGTVVSVGCDTEPFRTAASTLLACQVLLWVREHGNPLQLATKSVVPPSVLRILDDWPAGGPHPVVFTSLTSITNASRVEPGAPAPALRARNFGPDSRRWISAAMIKPVLPATERDLPALVDLMGLHRPDYIVVGVRYQPSAKGKAPHPVASQWRGDDPGDLEAAVVDGLAAVGVPVFHHSLCVGAHANRSRHAREVFEGYPHLCASCGVCSAHE